jgi:flagellar basal-body rod protein FlgF
MDRGSYVAASGGYLQFRKLEIVNNNLANINTPGFKKQFITGETQSFDQTLASQVARNDPYARGDHERNPGTVSVRSVTDFSQGAIKQTGNPLDVALRHPNDFFAVQTPEGIQYSRAGNFTLNQNGELVTQDGMQVLGDGGALAVAGAAAEITAAGAVRAGGASFGNIQVVRFADPQVLQRAGGTRFSLPQGVAAPAGVEPELMPQSLETANVSAITSVLDLISSSRGFELYSKTAQSIDQMNQQAISQIGRRQ